MISYAIIVYAATTPGAPGTPGAAFEETLRESASSSGGSNMAIVAAIIAMLIGVVLTGMAVRSVMRKRAKYTAAGRELCRRMGINSHSQRLLGRIARKNQLPGTASMLISRGCFEYSVKRYNARAGETEKLAKIRRRVFEDELAGAI